ncbi:MAG: hypothetical protein ABJB47_11775 [Actinomycetota bacterium]
MSHHLGQWGRAAAGVLALGRVLPAAAWAALAAAVIAAVMMGWILASQERTAHAVALITAARGQTAALPAPPPPAGGRGRRWPRIGPKRRAAGRGRG